MVRLGGRPARAGAGGAAGCSADPSLPRRAAGSVATWVVNSLARPAGCRGGHPQLLQVDLFVLVFQVWSEDFYLRPLLEAVAGRPLAAWCFQPWSRLPEIVSFVQVLRGSGPVGAFESLGTLRNLGAPFRLHLRRCQTSPRLLADLEIAARAGPGAAACCAACASDCCPPATSRCRALSWMSSACCTSWVRRWNICRSATWSALRQPAACRLKSKPSCTTCGSATRSAGCPTAALQPGSARLAGAGPPGAGPAPGCAFIQRYRRRDAHRPWPAPGALPAAA